MAATKNPGTAPFRELPWVNILLGAGGLLLSALVALGGFAVAHNADIATVGEQVRSVTEQIKATNASLAEQIELRDAALVRRIDEVREQTKQNALAVQGNLKAVAANREQLHDLLVAVGILTAGAEEYRKNIAEILKEIQTMCASIDALGAEGGIHKNNFQPAAIKGEPVETVRELGKNPFHLDYQDGNRVRIFCTTQFAVPPRLVTGMEAKLIEPPEKLRVKVDAVVPVAFGIGGCYLHLSTEAPKKKGDTSPITDFMGEGGELKVKFLSYFDGPPAPNLPLPNLAPLQP